MLQKINLKFILLLKIVRNYFQFFAGQTSNIKKIPEIIPMITLIKNDPRGISFA